MSEKKILETKAEGMDVLDPAITAAGIV